MNRIAKATDIVLNLSISSLFIYDNSANSIAVATAADL